MTLSFVAIDFETANGDLASVCQVGAAVVRGGALADVHQWEVQPATGFDSFDPRNVSIHGVTPDMAKAGMQWSESLQKLNNIVGQAPVVSHNAQFDSSAAYWASVATGQAPPEWVWYCTLLHFREVLPLSRHKLSDIARHFNIELDHHRAGSDAEVCAQGLLATHRHTEISPWEDRWQAVRCARGVSRHDQAAGIPISRYKKLADFPTPNPNPPVGSPFAGVHAVLTGDLPEMSRDEGVETLAAWGAQAQPNVTKKTSMLILGDATEARVSVDTGTGKAKKAAQLIKAGQSIKVMTGREFVERVRPQEIERVRPDVVEEEPPQKQSEGFVAKLQRWITGGK